MRIGTNESGQALPLIVLFMVSLLGVCGLVIDAGNLYQQKQDTQNKADAAALAGAAGIPDNTYSAKATHDASLNGKSTDSTVTNLTTYLVTNDSVTVTVTRQVPTFFISIFGFKTVQVTSTARATIQSIVGETGIAMPFGIFNSCVPAIGQPVMMYGGGSTCGTSSSNVGSIQVPAAGQTAGACGSYAPVGNGNEFDGIISGAVATGTMVVGGCLAQTQTGKGSGPGNDLDSPPWSTKTWPLTVLVPVLTQAAGQGTKGPYTINSFVWLSVTGCSGGTGPASCNGVAGKNINATYVGIFDGTSTAGIVTGAFNGSGNLIGLTQ